MKLAFVRLHQFVLFLSGISVFGNLALATPYDLFGVAVSNCGDVDGDGRPDVLIGDSFETEALPPKAGCVWLLSGGRGTVIRAHHGRASGDRFGSSITIVPDIDSDSVADYIVGAHGGKDSAGYYLMYSGKTGAVVYSLEAAKSLGPYPGLCAIGSYDSERVGRLVACQDNSGKSGRGLLTIYKAADGRILSQTPSPEGWTQFGRALSGVGDVDDDGIEDVAVSYLTAAKEGKGGVAICSGKDGRVINSIVAPSDSSEFGSVLAVGKRARTAASELYVGQPYSMKGSGVFVLRAGSLEIVRQHKRRGNWAFGSTLLPVGDVDNDEVEDLIVGAPHSSSADAAVWLLSGAGDKELRSTAGVLLEESHLGSALAQVGDWNGDKVDDIAMSAASERGWLSWPGKVRIVCGRNWSVLRTLSRAELEKQ